MATRFPLTLQNDRNTSAFANVHIFADLNFNDLDPSPVITLDRQAIEKADRSCLSQLRERQPPDSGSRQPGIQVQNQQITVVRADRNLW
jgi:hypothetical protein